MLSKLSEAQARTVLWCHRWGCGVTHPGWRSGWTEDEFQWPVQQAVIKALVRGGWMELRAVQGSNSTQMAVLTAEARTTMEQRLTAHLTDQGERTGFTDGGGHHVQVGDEVQYQFGRRHGDVVEIYHDGDAWVRFYDAPTSTKLVKWRHLGWVPPEHSQRPARHDAGRVPE